MTSPLDRVRRLARLRSAGANDEQSGDPWRPGRDPMAVRHPPPQARPAGTPASGGSTGPDHRRHVVVAGGGIAGLAAACGLAERGVAVTLVEAHPELGGRVRSWPVTLPDGSEATMSRGFHAFFRQYYNLRALLRRADPGLNHLRFIPDYPLDLAGGHRDSFADIPTTPPANMLAFVTRSPSFSPLDLAKVHLPSALALLDVDFPATYSRYDGVSAAEVLDRLRFPHGARHLALEVFARSFFADPEEFSGGELIAMFHTYFLGSAEGLLFDVADGAFSDVLWEPLARYLATLGTQVLTSTRATAVSEGPGGALRVHLAPVESHVIGSLDRIGPSGSTDVGETGISADAVVLALDTAALQDVVAASPAVGTPDWRERVAGLRTAPPFAVWRLWLDRPPADHAVPFLGTSNYGLLDNVSFLDLFEAEAAAWARRHGGCVVELHAYAVTRETSEERMRDGLWQQLLRIHPELADAHVLGEEWLLRDDCPLVSTDPWAGRPSVETPDPRVVLAGDGIRCDYPVALMERAATTGWMAANSLLAGWGRVGHDLWTVPMASRHAAVPALLRLTSGRPTARQGSQ